MVAGFAVSTEGPPDKLVALLGTRTRPRVVFGEARERRRGGVVRAARPARWVTERGQILAETPR